MPLSPARRSHLRAIVGGTVLGSRAAGVDVPGPPPPEGSWATLDRPDEAAAVRRALLAGRGVLLTGPAGVGKTYLLTEALAGPTGPSPLVWTISGGLVGPDEQPGDVLPVLADAGAAGVDGCPPLVRVEDAHLLPDQFALRLVRLAHGRQIRLAVTLRRLSAARSPWVELWKDGLVDRVDVRDVDAGQARTLLERTLGSPVAADTFENLWYRTRGNLFHLRELVSRAREEGTLVARDGAWAGDASSPPGPRVLDAVRHDVESLSPDARRALELVALAEPIPVSRVSLHVDGTALEDLELDGVVVVTTEEHGAEHVPTVRTAHPMYGDAVRVLVPVERRRRLFAAVRSDLASPMARVREPAATVVRSVEWALECGVQETGDRLVEAVEAAFRMRRWELVTKFVAAAVERLEADDVRVPRVLLRRAYAWWMRDEPGRAARDLDDVAARLFTDGGCVDAGLAVQLAVELADRWGDLDLHVSGDLTVALSRVEDVRRRTAGAATAEDVRGLEVVRLTRLGQAGRFQEFLEPALEILGAPDGDRDGALRLVDLAVLGLGQAGRFREACDLALRLTPAATVHPGQIPWVTGGLEVAHALVRLWAGEVDAARHYFAPDRRLEHGTPAYQAIKHVGLGLLAASAGQWSGALVEHRVASARFAVNDPMGLMAYAVAMEARATAAAGDAAAARELVDLALTIPVRGSAAVESDLRLHLLDAGAWLGAENLHGEAVRLARWCAARGQHRGELEALHRAVVLAPERSVAPGGGRSDLLGRIQALGGVVEGPRAAALVAHAEATVAGDAAFMESAADEVAARGLWLPTARRDASLTRREREIAALAARGLSSRDIADRLTVSVRTVDSHLSRVFAKLGVHSRRDLGPALRG